MKYLKQDKDVEVHKVMQQIEEDTKDDEIFDWVDTDDFMNYLDKRYKNKLDFFCK